LKTYIKKAFAEIRKNPTKAPKKEKKQVKVKKDDKNVHITINGKHKYRRDIRLNNTERKNRVAAKIQKFIEERKKAATKKK